MGRCLQDFIVRDLDKLKDYGFELAPSGDYYRIKYKNATAMVIDCSTRIVTFFSPCKSCIVTMCKMYANGDVIIVG